MNNLQFSQPTTYLIGKYLGNYRLVKRLGQGGFATVYLGEHRYLGTRAAVKVLNSQLAYYELGRFMREARITAHLTHKHIIRVLDFGIEDDIPFLVIEYAPYHTLLDLHPKGYRLPLATVVFYAAQIADALQYIHDKGIIHQDVKPENMLLGKEQCVLLSDFGISITAHKARARGRREVVGTLPYMAPEQLDGQPCLASDQYALAVVVYEWLTGRLPFEGSIGAIVNGHLYYAPPSLRNFVPTLPLGVERVVLKALAKTPEERFGSVREFAEALEQAYRQPTTQPSQSQVKRSKRRKQRSHLRGASGLLGASLVIGPALGLILRAFGLELEVLQALLVLFFIAFPLVVAFIRRNGVAFLCASIVIAISTLCGLISHLASVFFWVYAIASFLIIPVALHLGIRDEQPYGC